MPKCTTKPIVLISGSRSIDYINFDIFIDPSHVGAICHGGARGVDQCADRWARRYHLEVVVYEPKWNLYGKKAGIIRNHEMVEFCDVVIAFWDGKSAGTLDTITYAKEIGVPYIVHLVESLD